MEFWKHPVSFYCYYFKTFLKSIFMTVAIRKNSGVRKVLFSHHRKSEKHICTPFFGGKWPWATQHWAMESSSLHLILYPTSLWMSHVQVLGDFKIKMLQKELISHSTPQAEGWPMPHCNIPFVSSTSWDCTIKIHSLNEWMNEYMNEWLCSLFSPIKAIYNLWLSHPSWEHVWS